MAKKKAGEGVLIKRYFWIQEHDVPSTSDWHSSAEDALADLKDYDIQTDLGMNDDEYIYIVKVEKVLRASSNLSLKEEK